MYLSNVACISYSVKKIVTSWISIEVQKNNNLYNTGNEHRIYYLFSCSTRLNNYFELTFQFDININSHSSDTIHHSEGTNLLYLMDGRRHLWHLNCLQWGVRSRIENYKIKLYPKFKVHTCSLPLVLTKGSLCDPKTIVGYLKMSKCELHFFGRRC